MSSLLICDLVRNLSRSQAHKWCNGTPCLVPANAL